MNFSGFLGFRRSRWGKRVLWAAAMVLVYTLVGFFVLPAVIKWQMLILP